MTQSGLYAASTMKMELLLLGYLVVYLTATFFWRSWLVWRKTGTNPFMLTQNDDAHGYLGKALGWCIGLIALVVILNATTSNLIRYLAPILWLQQSATISIGWFLLGISLIWIIIAQKQMGDSWRIGIPQTPQNPNVVPLVTTGVFSYSRNPIFLGMTASLAGFFLVVPNAVSLVVLVLGFVLMQIQIRLEEAYLLEVHRDTYRTYSTRVRRWI